MSLISHFDSVSGGMGVLISATLLNAAIKMTKHVVAYAGIYFALYFKYKLKVDGACSDTELTLGIA